MMRIQVVTGVALLLLLTGCQATIQIVPNTPTITPTLRPGESTPTATPTWPSIFEDTATPGPAATATPTRTATAVPDTATPEPTATTAPADTATPEPTATAAPTDTATPEPTATAAPTNTTTPEPTATAAPTDTATPKPAATAAPTQTPTVRPTQTPTPQKAAAAPLRATATPKPVATVKPAATPRVTPTKPGLAGAAAAGAAAAGTPTPSSFSQLLTQQECNTAIQEAVATNPSLPVTNMACDFLPGQAVITGRAKLGFLRIDLAITVVVDVANCKATPRITKVDPAMAQSQVEAALQPYLGQLADVGEEVCVQKVTITDNDLIIEGTR